MTDQQTEQQPPEQQPAADQPAADQKADQDKADKADQQQAGKQPDDEVEDIDKGFPPGEYPEGGEGTFGYLSDEPGQQAGREEMQQQS